MRPLKLCDAHAHIGNEEELSGREKGQILTLLCASTPAEAELLLQRVKDSAGNASGNSLLPPNPAAPPVLIPTAGLHPWHAAGHKVSEMLPFLPACPAIGEIGMDSVWCDTPLDIQESVFREQLARARDLDKPVILHTKGQEKKIASILKEYPNTYLVHWYSCEQFLEDYLALDCYFSIGPDVWWNPAVRRVAETVPLNRLLIETDGMNAVEWAYAEAPDEASGTAADDHTARITGNSAESPARRRTPPSSPAVSLTDTLCEIAKIRHLPPEDAGSQIYHNLVHGFLKENLFSGM